jgi:hypothetical protein
VTSSISYRLIDLVWINRMHNKLMNEWILWTCHNLTANGVSWVLTLCTIIRLFRRFGEKCYSASSWTIFSDPEDGGISFLRNFGANIILHDVSNRKTIMEAKPPSNAENLNLPYQWTSNCKCTKSNTFHHFRSLMCITFAHSIIKSYRTRRKKKSLFTAHTWHSHTLILTFLLSFLSQIIFTRNTDQIGNL